MGERAPFGLDSGSIRHSRRELAHRNAHALGLSGRCRRRRACLPSAMSCSACRARRISFLLVAAALPACRGGEAATGLAGDGGTESTVDSSAIGNRTGSTVDSGAIGNRPGSTVDSGAIGNRGCETPASPPPQPGPTDAGGAEGGIGSTVDSGAVGDTEGYDDGASSDDTDGAPASGSSTNLATLPRRRWSRRPSSRERRPRSRRARRRRTAETRVTTPRAASSPARSRWRGQTTARPGSRTS